MKFESVLIEAVQKTNEYISLFLIIEKQPELILTEFFSGESENFLSRVIESSQELTGELLEPHDLQDELYKHLFPYLSGMLSGIELSYEKDLYPAPIYLIKDGNIIATLDIYQKQFVIVPHDSLQEEQERLTHIISEFELNQKEMEKYEGYYSNPLSYGETALDKMKISVRKTHYQKEIRGGYESLLNESMVLEQQMIAQRLKLERIEDNLRPFEDEQYQLAKPFRDKFRYRIKRLGEIEEELEEIGAETVQDYLIH